VQGVLTLTVVVICFRSTRLIRKVRQRVLNGLIVFVFDVIKSKRPFDENYANGLAI
jgi:hypothetical protein